MIDLRSDTVTRPSRAMLEAMMAAPVGDDVYGDDPTVNALQDYAAELSGKEAAIFLPTGTQANLVALLSHCERGEEYIVGQAAHNYLFEAGGAAVLGSIQPQPIDAAADGTLPLDKVAMKIRRYPFRPHQITQSGKHPQRQSAAAGIPERSMGIYSRAQSGAAC